MHNFVLDCFRLSASSSRLLKKGFDGGEPKTESLQNAPEAICESRVMVLLPPFIAFLRPVWTFSAAC
jgi:hypothetical protein